MKKSDKPRRGRPVTTGTPPIRAIRWHNAEWAIIEAAATLAGVPVSEFIRTAADRAAKKLLTTAKVRAHQSL